MEITERIDKVLGMPIGWDNEALNGNRPQQVLDYLQERFPSARFKKAHTASHLNTTLKPLKKGQKRAFLIVTNSNGGAIIVNGKRIAPIKGTLLELENQGVTIEYTDSKHYLVLEYSL